MRLTRTSRLTAGIGALCLAGSMSVLAACGGDDAGGTGSGAPLSDEAFCALVDETLTAAEELPDDEFESAVFGIVADLATRAPNAEIRDAMLKFGEVAEQLEGLDEDDPESFEEIFSIILDPSFIAAGETIDDYFTNTCGFDFDE